MAMGNGTLEQLVDDQYREDSTALLRRSRVVDAQLHRLAATFGTHADQFLWTRVLKVFHISRDNMRFCDNRGCFLEMTEKAGNSDGNRT